MIHFLFPHQLGIFVRKRMLLSLRTMPLIWNNYDILLHSLPHSSLVYFRYGKLLLTVTSPIRKAHFLCCKMTYGCKKKMKLDSTFTYLMNHWVIGWGTIYSNLCQSECIYKLWHTSNKFSDFRSKETIKSIEVHFSVVGGINLFWADLISIKSKTKG